MIVHGYRPDDFSNYRCPTCKGELKLKNEALRCEMCQVSYPIVGGIPDFILEDLTQSSNPVLRGVRSVDRLARIYETRLWYPVVLNLYGGLGSPSLEEIARIIAGMIDVDGGLILDVACGPGTYGRRVASESRTVHGIDISQGMLRRGVEYVKQDSIPNVHFARARVEALPFQDALFDAAICAGSLHLFADTVLALREIGRTLKAGAPLAVMTFHAGDAGILKYRWIRDHVEEDHGAHIFEIPELEGYLAEAGFGDFLPQTYGSLLMFSARKQGAQ